MIQRFDSPASVKGDKLIYQVQWLDDGNVQDGDTLELLLGETVISVRANIAEGYRPSVIWETGIFPSGYMAHGYSGLKIDNGLLLIFTD